MSICLIKNVLDKMPQDKRVGINWYIRFSSEVAEYKQMSTSHMSKNFMKEPTPYSVRATINPKILNGTNDYLSAANADSLDKTEENYNAKVAEISPLLGKFEQYRLNRVDYCFNFDPVELNMGCDAVQLFTLIKRGYIPRHFILATEYCKISKRWKPYKNDFRLKSNSMTISCYWKHAQLIDRFSDCSDLLMSRNVLRFEVKCYYPKVYAMSKSIKEALINNLSTAELMQELQYGNIINPTKNLMSDSFNEAIISKYFNKVIRKGDYFTIEGAEWMVKSHNFRQDKEERLLETLELIKEHRGIVKTLSVLEGDKLKEVKRSLKDLDAIFVNPVTMPSKWRIKHIPNPMRAYYDSIYEEQVVHVSKGLFIKRLAEYLSQ